MEKKYSIRFKSSAEKQMKNLPKIEQRRIVKRIDILAVEPRPFGAKKLSGEENLYRIRSGDYRIIYQIQDKILLVLVVKIGHRREVYR